MVVADFLLLPPVWHLKDDRAHSLGVKQRASFPSIPARTRDKPRHIVYLDNHYHDTSSARMSPESTPKLCQPLSLTLP